jgi:hypothetical protein
MALDCANSSVDGSLWATTGMVRLCLRDTDGGAYFGPFDAYGGPAIGAPPNDTTGFVGGQFNPQQLNDDGIDNNRKCFLIPYAPVPGATSDSLVIQETENNQPTGTACTFSFNFVNEPNGSVDCDQSIWT